MAACGRRLRLGLVAAALGSGVLIACLQAKEIAWIYRLRLQSLLPPDLGFASAAEGQQLAGNPPASPLEAARTAADEPAAVAPPPGVPAANASLGVDGGRGDAQVTTSVLQRLVGQADANQSGAQAVHKKRTPRSKHPRTRATRPKARGKGGLTFFSPPGRWPDCGSACRRSRSIPTPRNHAADYCDTTTSGYKTHYPFFVHSMLASAELHTQLGLKLRFLDDPFKADIVVCSHNKVERFLDDRRRIRRQLVIAVETGDSAHVLTPLNILSRPEVLAAVKHHSWTFPVQLCKDPLKETILRGLALRESPADSGLVSLTPDKVVQLLTDQGCQVVPHESFRKVHTSIPSWLTVQKGNSRSQKAKTLRPIAERQVDVTFVGAVNGNFRKAHRAGLVAALKAMKQKNTELRIFISSSHLDAAAYARALSNTKLFISPWGYGEWSGKDEEAILDGAVLLKPLASCMNHLMPMYTPNVTCLDVRPDWRNLEAVIADALGDPERLQRIQGAALEALRPFMGYSGAFHSSTAAFASLLSNVTAVAKAEFAKPWAAGGGPAGK